MSDTNLTKKATELSIQQRRQYQYAIMQKWNKGKITGKQCIEEIISLEKIIFVNPQQLQALKEKYEGPKPTPEKDS